MTHFKRLNWVILNHTAATTLVTSAHRSADTQLESYFSEVAVILQSEVTLVLHHYSIGSSLHPNEPVITSLYSEKSIFAV